MAGAPLALPSHVRQHLHADGGQLATALAAWVAQQLRDTLAARGAAGLFVSGGRTPTRFFEALSTVDLDWAQVTVSLVDDRWVPPDHADSNARLVREHLLRGAAAAARFIPLVDASAAPEQHLRDAERALDGVAADVVILGLGEDGHTASLFPGADGTAEAMDLARPARLAVVHPVTAPHARITLSLRALLQARVLAVHAEGAGKRAVLEKMPRLDARQFAMAALLRQEAVPLHVFYCA